MRPIFVPGLSKEDFRKLPTTSDLLRTEVDHFNLLEAKLPEDLRRALPQHVIVSEDDAVEYVDAMNRFLRSRIAKVPVAEVAHPAAPSSGTVRPVVKRRAPIGKRYLLKRRKQGSVWSKSLRKIHNPLTYAGANRGHPSSSV